MPTTPNPEIAALQRELVDAQAAANRSLGEDHHPLSLQRVEEIRYRITTLTMAERERARSARTAAAAGAKTGADVAAHLQVLAEQRRLCKTPLQQAEFDRRNGPAFNALEERLEALNATATPTRAAPTAERIAALRAEYQILARENPIAAAAFANRYEKFIFGGAT